MTTLEGKSSSTILRSSQNAALLFQPHVKNLKASILPKGVIRRIILFDKVLAKAEKSCLTPTKFKSDC
jgi:hypothetical protein